MVPTLVVESAGITRCRCIILEESLARRRYPARSRRKRPPHSLQAPKGSGSEPHGSFSLTRSLRPRCVHDALEANSRRPHGHDEGHPLERPSRLSALPEDAVIGKSVVGEVNVAAMLLMVSEF